MKDDELNPLVIETEFVKLVLERNREGRVCRWRAQALEDNGEGVWVESPGLVGFVGRVHEGGGNVEERERRRGTKEEGELWEVVLREGRVLEERRLHIDGLGQVRAVTVGNEVPFLGDVEFVIGCAVSHPVVVWRVLVPCVKEAITLRHVTLLSAARTSLFDERQPRCRQWRDKYEAKVVRRRATRRWAVGGVLLLALALLLLATIRWFPWVSMTLICVSIFLVIVSISVGSLWKIPTPVGPLSVFVNGWQSWSFAGAQLQGMRQVVPRMPSIFSAAFHDGSGRKFPPHDTAPRVLSSMFALLSDLQIKSGVLMGFLSQRKQFGVITTDEIFSSMSMHCTCDMQYLGRGSSTETDWACVQLMTQLPRTEPMAFYFSLVGKFNRAIAFEPEDVHTGWCSWYHYYEKLTEKDLLSNLEHLTSKARDLPVALFQVDDGYEAAWGDWALLKPAFSEGMAYLASRVDGSSMTPGIWLAPLSADKHSQLAKDHKDWIIRKQSGTPANSANCGKFFYGLDATIPEVQKHMMESLRMAVENWGFRYLKLDFLYSCILNEIRQDNTKTRAEIMTDTFKNIRLSIGPDVFLLGCGSPLGSAIGYVNAMRVSADAGPSWYPPLPLPPCKWNLPCGRNMVRNTITRMSMHSRWWMNDPDCILIRESTSFSRDEVVGIATVIAMSGGMFVLSDDLLTVKEDRMKIARALVPVLGVPGVALDVLEAEIPELLLLRLEGALGHWFLVALCNWADYRRGNVIDLVERGVLDTGENGYHVLEFWSGCYSFLPPGSKAIISAKEIAPHSARLFSVRPAPQKRSPMYLGSNIHFSCGREVLSWVIHESDALDRCCLSLGLSVGRDIVGEMAGFVWLVLPGWSDPESPPLLSGSAAIPESEAFLVSREQCVWRFQVQLSALEPSILSIDSRF